MPVTDPRNCLEQRPIRWRDSLLGKVTSFLLLTVAVAYLSGATTGWVMIERSQREEWMRQALTNVQITSSAIRGIYTFVSVDMTQSGQITRINSQRMIGDDQSVLDTGFVPVDVLALASIQTKEKVWLLNYDAQARRLVSMTDSDGGSIGAAIQLENGPSEITEHSFQGLVDGFATIDDRRYYIGLLPIISSEGTLLGAVAASAGEAERLMEMRSRFYRNSLLSFAAIMLATGLAIIVLMRRLFRPVPALADALKRLARDETGNITPFQKRSDEIGHLAVAIETLREAVVEREHLRKMRESARELEHLAHHDALTGLPNRAFLQKNLTEVLEKVESTGIAVNVMLLDLDRFKPVNDTYGHAVGDQVLITACKRVTMLLGPDDIFARLGGDEFALIQIVALDARKEARRLATRILEAISRPFQINDLNLTIGVSIGIANAPNHGNTSNQILSNADIALYMSKGRGRGCFHLYEAGMTMGASQRSAMELEIMEALGKNQFTLHYQPIVSTVESQISGYEALVRWQHPEKGLIPPDSFIPIAEETGFIVELDRWVLKQACQSMANSAETAKIAVNLSALGLLRHDLPDYIRATLKETGLAPERLEIEITETHRIAEKAAIAALRRIRAMGIGIAIDDFGTGFSSLTYLIDLPVTRIKLDRRFISGLPTSARCVSIVMSALSLAHSLDLDVTAEGVETIEQFQLLKTAGCQCVQGYLFGKPQAATPAKERSRKQELVRAS